MRRILGNPEQCLRVGCGFQTGEEHGIVACRFLTVAEAESEHPRQGVKPPDGTGEVRVRYATLEQLDEVCRRLSKS